MSYATVTASSMKCATPSTALLKNPKTELKNPKDLRLVSRNVISETAVCFHIYTHTYKTCKQNVRQKKRLFLCEFASFCFVSTNKTHIKKLMQRLHLSVTFYSQILTKKNQPKKGKAITFVLFLIFWDQKNVLNFIRFLTFVLYCFCSLPPITIKNKNNPKHATTKQKKSSDNDMT